MKNNILFVISMYLVMSLLYFPFVFIAMPFLAGFLHPVLYFLLGVLSLCGYTYLMYKGSVKIVHKLGIYECVGDK